MTTLKPAPRTTVATLPRDPRDPWPEHARKLHDHLLALYGDDPLPTASAQVRQARTGQLEFDTGCPDRPPVEGTLAGSSPDGGGGGYRRRMSLDEQIEKVRAERDAQKAKERKERERQERTRERLLALAADGVERLRP